MEFKGTKGKWSVITPEDSNGYVYVNQESSLNVATCYTVDYSNWEHSPTEETKANAQLIAHAPEMLEMLQRCKEYFLLKTDRYSEERADAIGDLIKKATKI